MTVVMCTNTYLSLWVSVLRRGWRWWCVCVRALAEWNARIFRGPMNNRKIENQRSVSGDGDAAMQGGRACASAYSTPKSEGRDMNVNVYTYILFINRGYKIAVGTVFTRTLLYATVVFQETYSAPCTHIPILWIRIERARSGQFCDTQNSQTGYQTRLLACCLFGSVRLGSSWFVLLCLLLPHHSSSVLLLLLLHAEPRCKVK